MNNKVTSIKGINLPKTKLGMAKMNKLADAAEELFATVGFYNTSIVDICRKANTAVGTFYIYFETKIDVYRFLIEKYKNDIQRRLDEAISAFTNSIERRREGIRFFVKYITNSPTAHNIIWGSIAVDRDMFFDCFTSFADSYVTKLFGDDESASVMSYSMMGISNLLGLKAIFEKMSDEDIDKMIDEVLFSKLV